MIPNQGALEIIIRRKSSRGSLNVSSAFDDYSFNIMYKRLSVLFFIIFGMFVCLFVCGGACMCDVQDRVRSQTHTHTQTATIFNKQLSTHLQIQST